MKVNSITKKITFSALFAALCCVATLVIQIPQPLTGYVNLGDAFVLMSGWLLGGVWGAAAAGIGTALADIISGYAIYAPATLIIKAGMAAVAFYSYKLSYKLFKNKFSIFARLISALLAELIMVGGYFLYEMLIVDITASIAAIVGNLLQGGVAILVGTSLIVILEQSKALKSFERYLEGVKEQN